MSYWTPADTMVRLVAIVIAIIPAIFISRSKFFREKFPKKFWRFSSAYVLSHILVYVAGIIFALGNFAVPVISGNLLQPATTKYAQAPTKTPMPASTKKPTTIPTPMIQYTFEDFLHMPNAVKGSTAAAFTETASRHAKQLDIPERYAYEWFLLSRSISLEDFTAYYKPTMLKNGFTLVSGITNILEYKKADRHLIIAYISGNADVTPNIWIFQWKDTPASLSLPEDIAFDDFLFMPGVILFTKDGTMSGYADDHARNLAIPAPYTWEWVELPDQSTATDFVTYYKNTMPDHGYKTVYDLDDPNGLYLLKFQKGNEMYAVMFRPESHGYNADVLIIRWLK